MRYDVSVRTRSTDRDYFWAGDAHPVEWWTTDWGNSLLRRSATALHRPGTGGGYFLNGIVSPRRDGSGARTLIRYELAFSPSSGGVLERDRVVGLLLRWWEERLTPDNEVWVLGTDFDRQLGAVGRDESVDAVLERSEPESMCRVIAAIADDCRLEEAAGERQPPDALWIGSDSPYVGALLSSQRPFAYFRSASRAEVEENHLDLAGDVTVIIEGEAGVCPPKAMSALSRLRSRLREAIRFPSPMALLALLALLAPTTIHSLTSRKQLGDWPGPEVGRSSAGWTR